MALQHPRRALPASPQPHPWFRTWVLLFAAMLAVAGAWLALSELARPPRTGFPVDRNYAAAADQRWKAALAARIGVVRGDLWAELFYSFADSIAGQSGRDFATITTLNEAAPAARRALAYAPYQSAVWLLLADMADKHELPNLNSGAALLMSYYTAPSSLELAPVRLSVAMHGDALRNPDLQPLAERELRMMFVDKPQLRPAVIAAYATASAEGRKFVDDIARALDPSFLGSLRERNP